MDKTRREFLRSAAGAAATVGLSGAIGALGSDSVEAKTVEQPTYETTDNYGRFDQKNTMFIRALWDKQYMAKRASQKTRKINVQDEFDGIALNYAGWWGQVTAAPLNSFGISGASPLMRWDDEIFEMTKDLSSFYSKKGPKITENSLVFPDKPAKVKYEASPEVLSRKLKNAAMFLGASLVGITKLDPTWVYSRYMDFTEKRPKEWPKDPAQFKYAVSIAIAMDYEAQRDITSTYASGSTGLGYSHMVAISSAVAKFIRVLGYPAIPVGNDTCTNVPIAINAGLGELGRNGLLITPQFGPRVRLCTVLTDMPLAADKPIDFGVKTFCRNCGKCAEMCPSKAIWTGDLTDEVLNMSNRPGVVRWPLDAEKCFDFWHVNRAACNACVGSCPFNKHSDIWFHEMMPKMITKANSGLIDSLFVKLDDFMGYGIRKKFQL